MALARSEGAGHRGGARHAGHPVLPAAERADRPAGGARVRPGAGQAAARPAGPPPADALTPAEGQPGAAPVTGLPRPATAEGSWGQAGLDALLADPGHALIATDFDGTLAPIVARPGDARAHPGAVPALIAQTKPIATGRVITGRGQANGGRRGVGHNGWQRWQNGQLTAPEPGPAVKTARAALTGPLREANPPEGTSI